MNVARVISETYKYLYFSLLSQLFNLYLIFLKLQKKKLITFLIFL